MSAARIVRHPVPCQVSVPRRVLTQAQKTTQVVYWQPAAGLNGPQRQLRQKNLVCRVSEQVANGIPINAVPLTPYQLVSGPRSSTEKWRIRVAHDATATQLEAIKALIDPHEGLLRFGDAPDLGPVHVTIGNNTLSVVETFGWPKGFTAQMVMEALTDSPNCPLSPLYAAPIRTYEDIPHIYRPGAFRVTVFLPERQPPTQWNICDEAGHLLATVKVSGAQPVTPAPQGGRPPAPPSSPPALSRPAGGGARRPSPLGGDSASPAPSGPIQLNIEELYKKKQQQLQQQQQQRQQQQAQQQQQTQQQRQRRGLEQQLSKQQRKEQRQQLMRQQREQQTTTRAPPKRSSEAAGQGSSPPTRPRTSGQQQQQQQQQQQSPHEQQAPGLAPMQVDGEQQQQQQQQHLGPPDLSLAAMELDTEATGSFQPQPPTMEVEPTLPRFPSSRPGRPAEPPALAGGWCDTLEAYLENSLGVDLPSQQLEQDLLPEFCCHFAGQPDVALDAPMRAGALEQLPLQCKQ